MRAVLLALTLIPLASAQPANAPKTARIEGTVRSSITGEPLQYTLVTLTSDTGRFAGATDTQGKFVLENIAPGGGYQLISQRSEYMQVSYGSRVPGGRGTPLTLSAGQVLKDLVISMSPYGVISGRITDSDGAPVEGAAVLAMRPVYGSAGRQFATERVKTDDRGEYRFAGPAPGRYYLSASFKGTVPSAIDALGAAPIKVAAGAETSGIDIRLRAARTYSLRGKALLVSTGAPAGGFTISSQRDESISSLSILSRIETQTHSDGTFEFTGLLPGPYILQIKPTRIATPPTIVSAETGVTIRNADADDVKVLLRPGVTLSGTVKLEGGDIKSLIPPGSSSRLDTTQDMDAFIRARMASIDGVAATNARPSVELANGHGLFQEDGTFSKIVDIPPSRYYLNVALLPDGFYVKSASFGGFDALRAPLDLTQGGGELALVLSNKAADVTGSLHNEKGEILGGVPVTLWPDAVDLGSATRGIRYTTTDQNGSFRFRNLPPGRYHVAAWEDADDGIFVSHEFLSRFNSSATEVKLAESEHATVNPKLIPADAIAAEVAKLQ